MVLLNEKDSGFKRDNIVLHVSNPVKPLTQRKADLFHFIFFASHLATTLIMDLQPFYPQHLVPTAMKKWFTNYLAMSRDPLVGGVVGNFGDSAHLAWFKTFLYLEFVFQTPIFIIALYALYYNKRTYYPLLAIYGAQSATTTLACLVHLVQTPESTPAIIKAGQAGITKDQRMLLLGGYIPFFLGALVVAIDFGWRSAKLIQKASKIEEEEKWK